MERKKYIFVGNRYYVLKKMIGLGIYVEKIYAVKDSFLSRWLDNEKIEYEVLMHKEEFVEILKKNQFDYLISNGCPYILPISKLYNGHNKFINIHPSLLPELRGKNPINGAILFERRHGVTCHYMTDEVDKGEICAQIEIPMTEDLDLDLLYQISFRLEAKVFEEAYNNNFSKKGSILPFSDKTIYYSKKRHDSIINKDDEIDTILKKVKAFSSEGQFASFFHNGLLIEVSSAEIIRNPIVREVLDNYGENTVLLVYGKNTVVFKIKKEFMKFRLRQSVKLIEGSKLID
nr:formyltransferase family protein [uncultured Schaedlerella sp.]